jgi:uncharacterized alpha-E superfamily protein
MAGMPKKNNDLQLSEENVLFDIGLNPESDYSIYRGVKQARENANSARDLISTGLYEAINKFYHYIITYKPEVLVKNGLHDYTTHVMEMSAILRGKIRGSLLHDETYAIIMMGVNIERAIQVIRIINTKYHDALEAQGSYGDKFNNSFEWTTLLKCLESYDMMRRLYKKPPTSISTLEFLILNPNCPRSIMNSLNQVYKHIRELDNSSKYNKNTTAFLVGKVKSEYEYKRIEEIEGNVQAFIDSILNRLGEVSQSMEKQFFRY